MSRQCAACFTTIDEDRDHLKHCWIAFRTYYCPGCAYDRQEDENARYPNHRPLRRFQPV